MACVARRAAGLTLMLAVGCGGEVTESRSAQNGTGGAPTGGVTAGERLPGGRASGGFSAGGVVTGGVSAGGTGSGGELAPRACSSYEASAPVARGEAVRARLAWTGHDYVALWAVNTRPGMDQESHWFEIHWARLDSTGSVVAEQIVYRTTGFGASGLPLDFGTAAAMGIAPYDQGFGVLWYEAKSKRLVLALLDAAGGMDPRGPQVVAADDEIDAAAVAWNGSTFGVAWAVPSAQVLRVATFDRTAVLLGSGELANVSPFLASLYLFGHDDHFLLFFEVLLPNLNDVWLAQFDQRAQLAGGTEAALLSDPNVYAGWMLVEPVGDEYAALWSEMPQTGGAARTWVLRRLDQNGSLVSGPFALGSVGQWIGLAYNGDEFGAVTEANDALAFQALGTDGTLHGARIEIAPRAPPSPGGGIPVPWLHAIHWNGDGFGVLWTGSAPAGWGTYYTLLRCVP